MVSEYTNLLVLLYPYSGAVSRADARTCESPNVNGEKPTYTFKLKSYFGKLGTLTVK